MIKDVYIVTGGAGFIGSNLIKKIIFNTIQIETYILCIDKKSVADARKTLGMDLKNDPTRKNEYIYNNQENLFYMELDMKIENNVSMILEGAKLFLASTLLAKKTRIHLIHCASPVGVNLHNGSEDLFDIGYDMSKVVLRMIDSIKRYFPDYIINLSFMSTSEIYGDIVIKDKDEREQFQNNRSYNYYNKYLKSHFTGARGSYVRQKIASELLFIGIEDINVKIYRLFNVFGSNQDKANGVVPLFIDKLLSNKDEVLTFSKNVRTYTPIDYTVTKIWDTMNIKVVYESDRVQLINVVKENCNLTDMSLLEYLVNNLRLEIIRKEKEKIIELFKHKLIKDTISSLWQKDIEVLSEKVEYIVVPNGCGGTINKYFIEVDNKKEIKNRIIGVIGDDELYGIDVDMFKYENLIDKG